MEFRLPESLQNQLASYDPILKERIKAVKKESTSTTSRKKSLFPLGQVKNLIPTNIVPEVTQYEIVKSINAAPAVNRVKEFVKHVQVTNSENSVVTERKITAILYHYESAWFAAWLPQEDETDKYLYGFTIAFKDGAKAGEKARTLGLNSESNKTLEPSYVKFGRSSFRVYTHKVTKEDITNERFTASLWNAGFVQRYGRKGQYIHPVIGRFEKEFTSTLPVWKDTYSLYDRLVPKNNTFTAIIKSKSPFTIHLKRDFTPGVESIINIFNPDVNPEDSPLVESSGHVYSYGMGSSINYKNTRTAAVFNTPFFRKWTAECCEKMVERCNNPATERMCEVTVPFNHIMRVGCWINFINEVWPETPIDYFRENINTFLAFSFPTIRNSNTDAYKLSTWLNTNMKVATFFNLLDREKTKLEEEINSSSSTEQARRRYFTDSYEMHCKSNYELLDTLNMLQNVLSNQQNRNEAPVTPPNRWRLAEFHDHVQAESWKISNENVALPQDLFPSPVKVNYNDNTWTFFQPVNTHQLASWGRAVRNCVGSSNYSDGIKNKKHFIVLCMLDNTPRFTVQLQVRDGVMSVQQIKDISNAGLDSGTEYVYGKTFEMALKQRAEELTTQSNKREEDSQ